MVAPLKYDAPFQFDTPFADESELVARMAGLTYSDEDERVRALLDEWKLPTGTMNEIQARARILVDTVRAETRAHGGLDAFLKEFELSSEEGVALMCLAEALLRVPDPQTADRLISDKIAGADWKAHLGKSQSLFVNASTWALMLTGRLVRPDPEARHDLGSFFHRIAQRGGELVVRAAIRRGMRIIGGQFVLAQSIGGALEMASRRRKLGYRHSFDMLGEAACTAQDASRYFDSYREAIAAIGKHCVSQAPEENPGISVKLSALHPRYEYAKARGLGVELLPRVRELVRDASSHRMNITIDAEESDRLELSLSLFEKLAQDSELRDFSGLGLAVQAYQKRAPAVIEWLSDLARRTGRRIMVRLVKGAYWDTEIKRAQVLGLEDYPVYTRKEGTDLSYLVCARRLLASDGLYPQFATHNAYTVAAVEELADRPFEFQCLHGMGEALYRRIVEDEGGSPCRIYAPVGSYRDLLPYLVRRLLENGANTSFVNRIGDIDLPVEELTSDPAVTLGLMPAYRNERIPRPPELYGTDRRNSRGHDTADTPTLRWLAGEIELAAKMHPGLGAPASAGRMAAASSAGEATDADVEAAFRRHSVWERGSEPADAESRAVVLERAADIYERDTGPLIHLCIAEAGKTLADAVAEVREAVDFLRYYAMRARAEFAQPVQLTGPTGETNQISLHARGLFVCISPWNFPLAIFTGQVAAALGAGNAVIAKPAEQTPRIGIEAVRLLHEAGVPEQTLQILCGDGRLGAQLVGDARVAGVAFTGSVETAKSINRALAARDGPIVPLIAETGGQNAMIVDSTALPEQVTSDVLVSAFQSAGQRCSALRLLCLQSDVAPGMLEMITGAMALLETGDPSRLSTDIGPIIDQPALEKLEAHLERMRRLGHRIVRAPEPFENDGTWFAPALIEINDIVELEEEVFGPVLHVIRFEPGKLDELIDRINRTGYGLTFGIHSRIEGRIDRVASRVRAGNVYANRNMTGAVVGVQPFGGEGLSGTGPKAGGPRYLHRFATERVLTVNTTAAGGNATLLSLGE